MINSIKKKTNIEENIPNKHLGGIGSRMLLYNQILPQIVDNLNSMATTLPLSANQGRVLNNNIANLRSDVNRANAKIQDKLDFKVNTTDIVDHTNSTAENVPLSANQGRLLKQYINYITTKMSANFAEMIKGTTNQFITTKEFNSMLSMDYNYDELDNWGNPTKITFSNGTTVNIVYKYPEVGKIDYFTTLGYKVTYHYNDKNYFIGKSTTVDNIQQVAELNVKPNYSSVLNYMGGYTNTFFNDPTIVETIEEPIYNACELTVTGSQQITYNSDYIYVSNDTNLVFTINEWYDGDYTDKNANTGFEIKDRIVYMNDIVIDPLTVEDSIFEIPIENCEEGMTFIVYVRARRTSDNLLLQSKVLSFKVVGENVVI